MPHRLLALLGHDVLPWARNRAGYSLHRAAVLIGVPDAELEAWEHGQKRPSWTQLRLLSDLYRTSIGVFFLTEPPLDEGQGNRRSA